MRPPVSSHPPYAACVGWLASWKLWVVSLKYQYFDTVFRQWKCDRIITIFVNAYRKRTVQTVLTNMWHQIRNKYRTRLQETLNTGRNPTARTRPQHWPTFDTPLRLVTSRQSFRQTRHLASPNISSIVHENLNFDILDDNHDVTAYERHYTSSLLSTCHRKNSSPAISTSWPQLWSRGQASACNWRNTPY